jgi:hypothetical protein
MFRQRAIAAGLVTGEQVFEKVVPAKSRPRFLIPPGTRVAVRNVVTDEWRTYTTTKENGFERFETYTKDEGVGFYQFRTGVWVMLVARRFVIHREDFDKLEQRLRKVAGR